MIKGRALIIAIEKILSIGIKKLLKVMVRIWIKQKGVLKTKSTPFMYINREFLPYLPNEYEKHQFLQ